MDGSVPGVQPIELVGADPYTRIETVSDGSGGWTLRVGCVGYYGLLDGGIEEVNPATGVSLGFQVTEEELGGDILAFVSSGQDLFILVSDASFITSLRSYDLSTDSLSVLDTGNGYVHSDLTWDGDFQLYLADRTVGAAGLRVFDSTTGAELTNGPLDTGLPPFQFVQPGTANVSATGLPAMSGLTLAGPFPNPCNPAAEIRIQGRPDGQVTAGLFDLRGRRVLIRRLVTDPGGRAVFHFEGRDERGRDLPAGVYRVVVQDGTTLAATSLTLLK
jgi:hypothetical protein